MNKKAFSYELTLKGLSNPKGEPFTEDTLQLEFNNHDDLFRILELAKDKALFENPSDTTEFFIGLKLFSEVLLRNRKSPNPMTQELSSAVANFMKQLKAKSQ